MYGLLIENLASFIRVQWGEGKWDSVRKHAGVDAPSFSIHHVYAESLLTRLARSACQILGVDEKSFFEAMGVYFVEYVGHYGYDQMMCVLGRHLRDFLNGLDNLHEYLKFSYTKMRAPSFYCDSETANGLRLHYRSKRRGFVWYTMGQIKQVAKHFYEQDIEIELISEELDGETMHNIFQLTFDNQAFVEHESLTSVMRKESQLPIRASIIFELFPFCIVFSTEMVITYTGHALLTILKDLVGQGMTEAFEIIRPLISFSFNTILERRNNIFELVTTSPIKEENLDDILEDETVEGVHLRLRGQMLFMEEWDMMLFLANPVMPDLPSLVAAGIFINDLSLHDCSRDLVLAGTQQSVELKLALDQEQHKSKKLEESMKKLDDEMKRTDELLYQMIPKQVADRLRKGESAVATCEVFEKTTILFSDVVTFTDICSRITPMQVVAMLNHMYSLFDQLTERNGVYKVETIGDSYMVVCGAPTKEPNHAERIADMAMDMIDASQAIKDPSREGEHLKLRVGCHSGMVVAGVVGVKMPRYCLFGDTVNTASRMESTSEASKIQISEFCKAQLSPTYKVELRGTVNVKGKGEMSTYWLHGREARVPLSKAQAGSFDWSDPSAQVTRRYSKSSDKGSRKSSVISTTDATETKSRDASRATTPLPPQKESAPEPPKATPTPAPKAGPETSTSKAPAAPATQPKVAPPLIETPAVTKEPQQTTTTPDAPESRKTVKPQKTLSVETDAAGNKMELNSTGKDLYRQARRLSLAIRSRSPSPAASDRGRSNATKITSNSSTTSNGEKPEVKKEDDKNQPSSSSKKVTLVRQVTLVDLPKKLAEVMNKPSETSVNIVKVQAPKNISVTDPSGRKTSEEDIIMIVPATPTNSRSSEDLATSANESGDGEQDRESFLINVKMKKGTNGPNNGKPNGLRTAINGIAVGISRLPKNQALRKKLRENKIAVVTADVLTDIGCVAFADKQKAVISQACSIL